MGIDRCPVELSFNDMSSDGELIFFDGGCGLCHAAVRFILDHDRQGRFRFAPLQGETFLERVPEVVRSRLPETLVVSTGDGRYLLRSDGAIYVLGSLGGSWRVLGQVMAWLPRRFRDFLYDVIARRRAHLFSRPVQDCPVAEPELRQRFDP
jgi:predicted DCC family thiol-disulfide oxidoreductase YuxK